MIFDFLSAFFSNQPSYLILYPTSNCNARCPHCYNSQRIKAALKGQRKELSLKEYQRFSSKLKRVYAVSISGGEPTLRSDLPQICHLFYKNNHTRYFEICSNGFLPNQLVTLSKKILKNNPQAYLVVSLSIDALGKKHDQLRGFNQGFSRTMESLRKLKKLQKQFPQRLTIKSTTIFSRSTQDNFLETIEFLSSQGIETASAFIRGQPRRKGEEKIDLTKYQKATKQIKDQLRKSLPYPLFSKAYLFSKISESIPEMVSQIYNQKSSPFPCQAGKSLVVIWDNGEVSPCEIKKTTLGNLRDFNYDLDRILHSPGAKKIISQIKQRKCNCTWENMILVNQLRSPRFYPRLGLNLIKDLLQRLTININRNVNV